jgi:transcriptional regulator with XRE-family HTH domain
MNPLAKIIHDSHVPVPKMAERLGCGEGAVMNWIAGRNAPTRSKYNEIAALCRVPASKVAAAADRLRESIPNRGRAGSVIHVKKSAAMDSNAEDMALDALSLASDILKMGEQHRATIRDFISAMSGKGGGA